MLRVALVNPPHNTNYPQPPLGLMVLDSIVVNAGHVVNLVDAPALNLNNNVVCRIVQDYDVVGITAMTVNIQSAVKLAREIRKAKPEVLIILGGPYPTLVPVDTMKACPEIDIIVRGEGEETIKEILDAYEDGKDYWNIAGITYRNSCAIVNRPDRYGIVDLQSLPLPSYRLLNKLNYKPMPPRGRALPFAMMVTSRGCPYNCTFCAKPVFGKQYRAQSAVSVVSEIEYLYRNYGIKEIGFFDDMFVLDKARVMGICEGLLGKGIDIKWTCEARVNLVDREMLAMMKRAGCYAIAYGLESGDYWILKIILHKGITPEESEEAIFMTRESGIETIGYFMLGSPGDTPESIQKTIDFAKKLKLDYAQFAITTPYPGTELYRYYCKSGGEARWEDFVYKDSVKAPLAPIFENKTLDRESLRKWESKAIKQFYLNPAYLWRRFKRIRTIRDILVNLKGLLVMVKAQIKANTLDKLK